MSRQVMRHKNRLSRQRLGGLILAAALLSSPLTAEAAPAGRVWVDETHANRVLQGRVDRADAGPDGVQAVLRIINTSGLWLNLLVEPIPPDLKMTPDVWTRHKVLPPKGEALLNVTFGREEYGVSVLADFTLESGPRAYTLQVIELVLRAGGIAFTNEALAKAGDALLKIPPILGAVNELDPWPPGLGAIRRAAARFAEAFRTPKYQGELLLALGPLAARLLPEKLASLGTTSNILSVLQTIIAEAKAYSRPAGSVMFHLSSTVPRFAAPWRRTPGLHEVHPDQRFEGRTPLVLVHGWSHLSARDYTGWDRFVTFYEGDSGLKASFKLFVYNYVPNSAPIRDLGRHFGEAIDLRPPNREIRGRPFVILAHSMGGLVAREMMNNYQWQSGGFEGCSGGTRVLRLITLGTPHLGVKADTLLRPAEWYDSLVNGIGRTNVLDMNEGSAFLQRLNADQRFDRAVVPYWSWIEPRALDLRIGRGATFYERLALLFPRQLTDGIVPDHSAEFRGRALLGNTRYVRNYNHDELARGKEPNDAIFRSIGNDLQEASRAAPGMGVETVLVLDRSGSMGDFVPGGVKIEIAKRAAGQVLGLLDRERCLSGVGMSGALVSFSREVTPTPDTGLTTDFSLLSQALGSASPGGATNIGDALSVALSALPAQTQSRQIIILLSDGVRTAGPTNEEILSGPVASAASRGIRVYTVGFNQAQHLDEPFLREVASRTGGEYFRAEEPFRLENVYLNVYHQGTGQLLAAQSGTVAQGQTVDAARFTIPQGTPYIRLSLNWPGSRLGLVLIDPRGKEVTDKSPGALLSADGRPIHAFLYNPMPGLWTVRVRGVDVPGATEPFDLFVSKPAPVEAAGGLPLMLLIGVALVTGGGVAVVLATRGKRETLRRRPARAFGRTGCSGVIIRGKDAAVVPLRTGEWTPLPARVTEEVHARPTSQGIEVFLRGKEGERRIRLRLHEALQLSGVQILAWASETPVAWFEESVSGKVLPVPWPHGTMGRSADNAVQIDHPSVSRRHANLEWRAGQVILTDLGSHYGTFVEGTRVRRAGLTRGNTVRLGGLDVRFWTIETPQELGPSGQPSEPAKEASGQSSNAKAPRRRPIVPGR